ncbi:hypothetical protein BGW80DRAFT_1312269, partial [Lactifluus volemus]
NRTRISSEDLDNLYRTGKNLLRLVEGQATEERYKQEMDQYKEMSNRVVEMLEARVQEAAALVQGSSSSRDSRSMSQYVVTNQNTTFPIGLPSGNTSSRVNDGASTSATYAGSAVEPSEAKVDPFLVTLQWSFTKGTTLYNIQVQAVNIIGDPMKDTWPHSLRLKGFECSWSIYDFQTYILKNKNGTSKMSMAQFQHAPGTERQEFDQLVKWLREGPGYAAASWTHHQTPNLVLKPCEEGRGPGLFVAIFPVSGAPNLQLPHRRSQGPRPQTSSNSGIPSMPLAGWTLGQVPPSYPSPYGDQANMSRHPVQQLLPQVDYQQMPQQHQAYPHRQQQHPSQEWQTLPQSQMQRARQGQHVESGNTGGGDPNYFPSHYDAAEWNFQPR